MLCIREQSVSFQMRFLPLLTSKCCFAGISSQLNFSVAPNRYRSNHLCLVTWSWNSVLWGGSTENQHIPDNSHINPAGVHPAAAEGKSRVIREVRGQAHKAGALEVKPMTLNQHHFLPWHENGYIYRIWVQVTGQKSDLKQKNTPFPQVPGCCWYLQCCSIIHLSEVYFFQGHF